MAQAEGGGDIGRLGERQGEEKKGGCFSCCLVVLPPDAFVSWWWSSWAVVLLHQIYALAMLGKMANRVEPI